ncbi:peptidase M56 [Paenibacillus sp. EKM211P]|uniref:peptidase M56 n=1 Tax=Paenibacillus sp. EKM211P TaxID=1683679 RepID=UPI0013E952C5|nr:peptidase M56 [Paenibacillus sp. EKM211P]KAF6577998.1 peptidase M56 [Paenibacillus sp. EKM211P]
MIFKNKKRLHNLFAAAVLLLLFLSAVLLINVTDTEENVNSDINARTVLKAGDASSFKIDRLNSSFQWFHSLDRAIQFTKFDFKVPDHLPEGYQLEIVDLSTLFSEANQADLINVVTITFVSQFGSKNEQFIEMLASKGKGNMLEHNLLWGAPDSQKLAQTQFFQQNETTIGNVKGVLFTKKQGSQHNRKAVNSFVWQDNGVSYAINWEKLTQEELQKVVHSFAFPHQIQHVRYDGEGNSFPLYDETDLLEAKNILRFKVKFPDSLPNTQLTLNDSILLRAEDQNTGYSFRQTADVLWNIYRAPYNSTIYDDPNDELLFYQSKVPLFNTAKFSFIRKLEISGVEISAYADNTHVYFGPLYSSNDKSKLKNQTYYFWKQNGVYYATVFLGLDKNQEENLRTLLLTPLQ